MNCNGCLCPSLLEWIGFLKAMALRILPSLPPGYLSPVAMRAPVVNEYVLLPLHGGTCWLGVFFMSFLNFTGPIAACNLTNTNNMKQRVTVHVRVCVFSETIYMLIFSPGFCTSGLGFSHHPRGPLSQHPP